MGVVFPAPTASHSQVPVTPALWKLIPLLTSSDTSTHAHIHTDTKNKINLKEKTNLIRGMFKNLE